jgi:hypothetical protein
MKKTKHIITTIAFAVICASAFAEDSEPKNAEPAIVFDARHQILKIYTDLFLLNPINISISPTAPEFAIVLPTDDSRNFVSIKGKISREGDDLRLLLSLQKEIHVKTAKDEWETRMVGFDNLPVLVKLGKTIQPIEINGKVLRVTLGSEKN